MEDKFFQQTPDVNLLNIVEFKTPAMNKLIIVTGGSKGIGRAVIEKFARNGFDIITCARHESELKSLKDELEKANPYIKVFYCIADIAQKTQVDFFVDFVLKQKRDIDVLVNNAGFFIPGEISTENEGALESMMNANLYSAYHITRGLVYKMKEKRSGHIFNICSIASFTAYANGGSYAISKYALLGFSKCLRQELMAHNIRVTSVMPGATKTRSWENVDLPDERFIPAEDIAETIYAAYSLSKRSVVEDIVIRPQLGDIESK
jgi:short-subunit dehydrogenase